MNSEKHEKLCKEQHIIAPVPPVVQRAIKLYLNKQLEFKH